MAGHTGQYFSFAVGRQTAKGTPQTTPAYKLKFTGGDIAPIRDVIQLQETDASRQQSGDVVVGARIEGTPEIYVRPSDYGLWAYALLGANADAGTASNYIHTASIASSGPYLTVYKAIDSTALVDRYSDVRVTSHVIRGQAGAPLTCAINLAGITALFGQTDPVLAPVSETPFTYPNVTIVKNGSDPLTVESFELTIDNQGSFHTGDGSIFPYEYIWGRLGVSGTATLLFESDADYRKFHTGSATGTSATTTVFTEQFEIWATINANLSIAWRMQSVAYNQYPIPPDPSGAPIKVALGFRSQPNYTTPANYISIETRNQVATY